MMACQRCEFESGPRYEVLCLLCSAVDNISGTLNGLGHRTENGRTV